MKTQIEKLDRLIREIEMDEYLNEETLPKIRDAKSLLNTLHEQCNIAIVSGSYYWVKCFTDDKYEPTLAIDHYNNGTMYFKFLNGAVKECRLVADYKELNYR